MDQYQDDLGERTKEFSGAESQPRVIAKIPDLNARGTERGSRGKSAKSDGRLLSQGFSTKLLIGGGALLVLVAIVPLIIGGRSGPKGGQPPAPNAEPAPIYQGGIMTETQVTLDSAPVIQQAPPELNFQREIPTGPAFTATVPQTPIPNVQGPVAGGEIRYEASRPLPGYRRECLPPQTERNRPPQTNQNQPPRTDQGRPQAKSNQRMKLGRHTPGSPARPGVARLTGVIVNHQLRTTNDRNRSSIY